VLISVVVLVAAVVVALAWIPAAALPHYMQGNMRDDRLVCGSDLVQKNALSSSLCEIDQPDRIHRPLVNRTRTNHLYEAGGG
jgi:hypothetical protein